MSNATIRWSGVLLIIGAVLLGTAIVLATLNQVSNQGFSPLVSYLFLLAAILLLVSLPGMYAAQANAAGWLGLAGYALLQAGIVLFAMLATPGLWYPSINEPFPESVSGGLLGIALILGLLLTAVATIRAGVYPRGAGILLLIGMASFFFGFFVAEYLPSITSQVSGALLGSFLLLAFAWIGFAMLKEGIPPNAEETGGALPLPTRQSSTE